MSLTKFLVFIGKILLILCVQPVLWSQDTVKTAPYNCESFGGVEEALKVYLEAEMQGYRLEAGTRERTQYCFMSDDVAAWDLIRVIEPFSFDKCKEKKKGPHCYKLRYGVLGEVYSSQEFKKNDSVKYEEIEIKIIFKEAKWHLSGWKDIPPLVTKAGVLRFAETQRKSHSNKKWIESLIKHMETLK